MKRLMVKLTVAAVLALAMTLWMTNMAMGKLTKRWSSYYQGVSYLSLSLLPVLTLGPRLAASIMALQMDAPFALSRY